MAAYLRGVRVVDRDQGAVGRVQAAGGGRGSPTRKGGVSEETGTVLAVGSRVQKERAVRVCGQR